MPRKNNQSGTRGNSTLQFGFPFVGYLNSTLSLQTMSEQMQSSNDSIAQIRNIRKYLTGDTTHTLIKSLVTSHLDYSNSITIRNPKQNTKINPSHSKYSSKSNPEQRIIQHMYYRMPEKPLHWFPIKERINYKICSLVHKLLHGKAPKRGKVPKYIQDLINQD